MHVDGAWFKDEQGRTMLLRGANLGGSSKVPYRPDGATYRADGFYDHRNVSFVGRPFPLAEADEHFARLRAWGMRYLRFLVTWEAIEHAGPGQYDEEYLDYVHAVVEKAAEYGIDVFIDPHQDVWSRFTGGDGAPGWTLEAVGMDITRLSETGAAIVHAVHGDPFPQMIWPTNYTKLGAATLFTLFFAGDTFAPQTRIDGVPVQEYLQGHYIGAIKHLALRLRDLPNVVGYDSLNEPGSGFIGIPDLSAVSPILLFAGATPSPFQAMLLGAGYPQEVELRVMTPAGAQPAGRVTLNPDGISLWRPGYDCVWRANGVWTDAGGPPRLLRPDHFRPGGQNVDVADRFLKPFICRFIQEIRRVAPDALLFLEGVPPPRAAHPSWSAADPPQTVNAAHWYDALTLFRKTYNPELTLNLGSRQPVMGREAVRQSFVDQLAAVRDASRTHMGGILTLIGEFGIPYDLDGKAAYQTGDFSTHVEALDAYYSAMEANLLNCTIWNYTADNSNARGDQWNDEDLSIFSLDQQDDPTDLNSGGRALAAIVRPYPLRVAGEPLSLRFDLSARSWEFTFRHDPAVGAPTEIFVPDLQYPDGYTVSLSDGVAEVDRAQQLLVFRHGDENDTHTLHITPA